jgi:hypothetical protein
MASRTRSPFGELLRQHRQRLGPSQRELANRAFALAASDPAATPVAERTIIDLERRHRDRSA